MEYFKGWTFQGLTNFSVKISWFNFQGYAFGHLYYNIHYNTSYVYYSAVSVYLMQVYNFHIKPVNYTLLQQVHIN